MSMGTTKMKMKDLGEGGKRSILLAHLYKAAESHRGSSHSSKIPNDSLSKPLPWLRPSSA
jgi:hypothetical protein